MSANSACLNSGWMNIVSTVISFNLSILFCLFSAKLEKTYILLIGNGVRPGLYIGPYIEKGNSLFIV